MRYANAFVGEWGLWLEIIGRWMGVAVCGSGVDRWVLVHTLCIAGWRGKWLDFSRSFLYGLSRP